jgi:peptide chain release factor 1
MLDKDLKITITRGSGPGGQHRNKVETCVTVMHIPTGLTERCQDTRSQLKNLELAKERLLKRINDLKEAKKKEIVNNQRIKSINIGVIRTYNFARSEVKNHINGKKANLQKVLNGDIELLY